MCLDVHGDEALPYIFLAGNEARARANAPTSLPARLQAARRWRPGPGRGPGQEPARMCGLASRRAAGLRQRMTERGALPALGL